MGVSIPETFPVTVRSTRFWGKSLRGRLWRQIPTQAERRFQPLFKPDAAFFQEPLIRKSLTLNLSYARDRSCQDPSVQVLCSQVPPCPRPALRKSLTLKEPAPSKSRQPAKAQATFPLGIFPTNYARLPLALLSPALFLRLFTHQRSGPAFSPWTSIFSSNRF